MREILFKGKRKDNGEWIEGSLILTTSTMEKPYIVDSCWCYSGSVDDEGYAKFEYLNAYEVIPESVSEFTGLTDKNGKKIFTKDIVAITALGDDHHQKGVKTIAVVEDYMGNTCLCIDGKHKTGTTLYDISIAHTVEVIGDTTDNPELLKGGVEE